MKTPPHIDPYDNGQEQHPYTDGNFEAWGEEDKSCYGSFTKPQVKGKPMNKQSSIKHEDGQTTPIPRGAQPGIRMKMLHKDIIEATGGGGTSIEDSIGVVGSSIGKSAAHGSRRRNAAQQ